MRKFFGILPKWLVLVVCFLLVALVGYADYITGDYSMLIFYLVPIALAAWYVGRFGGIAMAVASGGVRIGSDYSSFTSTSRMYWNCVEDMIFLLVVALLISTIKKQLKDEY
ncbi:hypothetical protein [Geotalea uraniireducens]|uniref:Transmembrane protein n=1 Tax=Geotalea uraniireducens (strain Rf4) TaxID=351605 RepID=A5G9H2_GEOUR|nr:hypothetical protein [Geotalea uraniireducens]ABQ28440.1 hypothetical protein Gura_4297 [Geotalea uraniireducens Rf4]